MRARPRRFTVIHLLSLVILLSLSLLAGCAGGSRVVYLASTDAQLQAPSAINDYPEALATAAAVMREAFGLEANPVTLFIYSNRRAFEQGLIEAGGISPSVAEATVQYARAIGTKGKILVNEDGLTRAPWGDRLRLLAHELTHVAQFSLSGGIRSSSDQWMREGFADWVSFRVVERLGLDRYQRLRADMAAKLAAARQRQALPGLDEISSFSQWDSVRDQRGGAVTYGVAFFAVEHLINQRGHEAVSAYFRLFAFSQDRVANFRKAFGMELEEFERDFSRAFNEIFG